MYYKFMTNLTPEQKLYRMFILGMTGEKLEQNPNLIKALNRSLGGVIFFTENIQSAAGFKELVSKIKKEAANPIFLSIDQEGGRVERTEKIHNGKKYLSAQEAAIKGEEFVRHQSALIAEELHSYGLNMNYAPVLDVNTNSKNPIIGNRSYSKEPEIVSKCGEIVMHEFLKKGILPVGKHFPGHGQTDTDSHKTMPEVNLNLEKLENIHIKPFKDLIESGLPAIMAAHVHYCAFDKNKIPGSISPNVLGYLRKNLNFKGIIISDDMVMGGIKNYSPIEACIKGINAGINMFIYRNSDDKTIELIEELIKKVEAKKIDIEKIDYSVELITKTLNTFKI